MTKADIVQAVYTRLGGFSKKESADLVDLVFETMKETLGRGEKIKISGFGNFVLRDKRQRQGRNPQTGDPITITERRVLNFKASQLLKQALNEERDSGVIGDGREPPHAAVEVHCRPVVRDRDGHVAEMGNGRVGGRREFHVRLRPAVEKRRRLTRAHQRHGGR